MAYFVLLVIANCCNTLDDCVFGASYASFHLYPIFFLFQTYQEKGTFLVAVVFGPVVEEFGDGSDLGIIYSAPPSSDTRVRPIITA